MNKMVKCVSYPEGDITITRQLKIAVIFVLLFLVTVTSCSPQTTTAESEFEFIDGLKTKNVEGFGGVIAESYEAFSRLIKREIASDMQYNEFY